MQCSYCDVRWVKVTSYYDPLYTTNWHICKGSRGWYLSGGGRCARYNHNHDWPLAFLPRGLSMYFASSSRQEGRQAYQHLAAAQDAHASLKARCLGHSSVKCGGGDGTWETRWSNGKLLRRCASPSAHFLCKSRPGPSPASKSSQTPRPTVHLSLHFWLIVIAGPDLIDSPTPTRTPHPHHPSHPSTSHSTRLLGFFDPGGWRTTRPKVPRPPYSVPFFLLAGAWSAI